MDTQSFITFMVMWMLLFFGVLAIILTYRHNRHVVDLNHKERMSALERGLELPPQPTPGHSDQPDARQGNYLQRGLMLTLLGLSLMAALGVNAGVRSALWGLPVAAFGIGYLILYSVAATKEKQS
jgi:hypothetical protein